MKPGITGGQEKAKQSVPDTTESQKFCNTDPTHHPKRHLDRFTHFRTNTPLIPHWLQWDSPSTPKITLCRRAIANPNYPPHPLTEPTHHPNGIQIQSAVLPQLQTQGWTDGRWTNRWDWLCSDAANNNGFIFLRQLKSWIILKLTKKN